MFCDITSRAARAVCRCHSLGVRTLRTAATESRNAIPARSTVATSNENDNDSNRGPGGWPHPIYASARTETKKSIFVAHASRLPSPSPPVLRAFLDHLTAQPALKRATHCMYAWRSRGGGGVSDSTSAVTPSSRSSARTSNLIMNQPPSQLQSQAGQNDGGEKGAGERLARLLEASGCEDVVVVVSRWYGGVKLGSERWKMISSVAKDALAQGDFRATPDASSSQENSGGIASSGGGRSSAKGSANKKKRK